MALILLKIKHVAHGQGPFLQISTLPHKPTVELSTSILAHTEHYEVLGQCTLCQIVAGLILCGTGLTGLPVPFHSSHSSSLVIYLLVPLTLKYKGCYLRWSEC